MKFVVSRSSISSSEEGPLKGATKIKKGEWHIDHRCVRTLEEARQDPRLGKEWLSEGENHRTGKTEGMVMVCRDVFVDKSFWVITMESLAEVVDLVNKKQDIILKESGKDDIPIEIVIFDEGHRGKV